MPTDYKNFNINDSTTPAPWGPRETTWNENIIDTVVLGTVTGVMDNSIGHQHYQLQDQSGNLAFHTKNGVPANQVLGTDATKGVVGVLDLIHGDAGDSGMNGVAIFIASDNIHQ